MPSRPDIAVFGAGVWGTALAIAWARAGHQVALWGHTPSKMEALVTTRRHPRLNGIELPQNLHPMSDPAEAFTARLWISSIATQASPAAWAALRAQAPDWGAQAPDLLLHTSKGILAQGHQRLAEALEPLLDRPVGVLSGPTFADEVARNLPSAMVMALPMSVSEARAVALQHELATEHLRIYLSRDVVGVELCGALKNVLAIAAGLVENLGLGHNARAALITRGLAEISRLVAAMGGGPDTVMGLAGMGDLLLTATGPQSRNRRLGAYLAEGRTLEEAQDLMGGQVMEGASTTKAALALGRQWGVELPIAEEVARLLDGANPREAVGRLMNRSLKSE
ncbi:MAG: NAD(P)-dependent glycerol-3-phosphate dehydrogenase [Holophagaceae bacterium]|nr:NAD(P)-dependent glycerol-3-phosphate dehydrogenase [Holophagaceae bacterium]